MASVEKVPKGPWWAVAGATALGAGLSPVAPGTFGTLAGIALYMPVFWAGIFWWAAVGAELALVLILSALCIPPVLAAAGTKDPQFVVLDEVAGILVALASGPPSLLRLLGAFLLFRALDILKPFPVGRLERLPGTWGVLLDDVAAGLIAALLLALARRWLP